KRSVSGVLTDWSVAPARVTGVTAARIIARKKISLRIALVASPSPRPGACRTAQRMVLGVQKVVNPGVCYALAAALVSATIAGCSGPPTPPNGLVVALPNEPQSLDPRFGMDANSARVADLLHVGLTRADTDARRVGDLAERWDEPDPTTLVFHLR